MKPRLRITDSPAHTLPVTVFVVAVFGIWIAQLVAVFVGAAHYPETVNVLTRLWVAGYCIFSFNTCFNFCLNIVGLWLRQPKTLPELPEAPPRTVALVCPVFCEDPELVFVRLEEIIRGNRGPSRAFWVLSDSPESCEEAERAMVERLRAALPCDAGAIHYRRRTHNTDYKAGNVSQFLYACGGFDYDYLVVIDSDSYLPPGTVSRLLAKAEHPDNARVFHFQARLAIYHARTRWAQFQKFGTELGSRLVLPALFCGQSVSWGHNCLVRTSVLRRMYEYRDNDGRARPLPTQERSHDVFDFLYGSILGYSAQYVHDVLTYEEAPATMSVSAARQERWARGSLSATKLIFEPAASLYARGLVWFGSMTFLNSTFLFWLLLSLWLAAHPAEMHIHFPNDWIVCGVAVNRTLLVVAALSLFTFFGFPLLVASCALPLRRIAGHIVLGNLILMSQLTSGVAILIRALFFRPGAWLPTGLLSFSRSASLIASLPCAALSIFAAAQIVQVGGLQWWMLFAAPVIAGGIVSPFLAVYLDAPADAL